MPISPSAFVRCEAEGDQARAGEGAFFRCTVCGSTVLRVREKRILCDTCGAAFPVRDRIYHFRGIDG